MKKSAKTEILGSILLFITALIWGFAFVAQSKGMESVGPCTFNGLRSFMAAFALAPLLIINRRKVLCVDAPGKDEAGNGPDTEEASGTKPRARKEDLKVLLTGLVAIGMVFFLATTSQQIGIGLTDSVGKAGFITALYIVLVPLAGIFLKKPPKWIVFLCVAAATFGLFLLCIPKGSRFTLRMGDLLLIACAILFTAHILLINYYSARINGLLIAVVQFLFVGVFCGIVMIVYEKPAWEDIVKALPTMVYAGLLSSAVGYTFQILGQKYVEPTKASLIMCLESVFSVLGGWLLLHQELTLREGIGCVIMFVAILVCQIFGQKPGTLSGKDHGSQ